MPFIPVCWISSTNTSCLLQLYIFMQICKVLIIIKIHVVLLWLWFQLKIIQPFICPCNYKFGGILFYPCLSIHRSHNFCKIPPKCLHQLKWNCGKVYVFIVVSSLYFFEKFQFFYSNFSSYRPLFIKRVCFPVFIQPPKNVVILCLDAVVVLTIHCLFLLFKCVNLSCSEQNVTKFCY